MDRGIVAKKEDKNNRMFQLGHSFSAMDRAAIFRPSLISKKS